MHILILPMYYPEKDSSPHRGYMFFEQAMQLVKSGCKTGLAFTEQRPLKTSHGNGSAKKAIFRFRRKITAVSSPCACMPGTRS